MSRLSLTPVSVKGPYDTVTANSLDFVFTAAGASFADGAGFTLTGREVLIVRNGNVGAQTVTVTSVADDHNRTGDITAYSLGPNEYAVFPFFVLSGWQQTTGLLHIAASAADVEFAVLRLPR